MSWNYRVLRTVECKATKSYGYTIIEVYYNKNGGINGYSDPKRRGRPKLLNRKISQTIHIDADVLKKFRGIGKDWQTRINQALRKELGI